VKPSVRRAPEGAFRYVRGIMDKPFKTYTELLDFLEKEKRLSIPDRAMAEEILSKTGYYSLITGYKELFKDKTTGYYNAAYVFVHSDGRVRGCRQTGLLKRTFSITVGQL